MKTRSYSLSFLTLFLFFYPFLFPLLSYGAGFDLDAALTRAALRLFPPRRKSALYAVALEGRVASSTEGATIERWSVRRGSAALGSFTRLQLRQGADTRIDLAFRLEDGRIRKVVPVQMAIVERNPILDVERVFAPFLGAEPARVGEGMAAILSSLTYLERVAALRDPSSLPGNEAFLEASRLFFNTLPKPGRRCPAFSLRCEGMGKRKSTARGAVVRGAVLRRADFAGRPFLVAFGTVTDEDDRALLKGVSDFHRRRRIPLVNVLLDGPAFLALFQRRGGKLSGRIVLDPSARVQELFRVPVTPYLVGYDGQGRLALRTLYEGKAALAKALAAFERSVKKGAK